MSQAETLLLAVRHGQTAWNTSGRLRGRAEVPLDDVGLRQAEAVADYLAANYKPAAVFASPLERTVITAQAIASRFGLAVAREPDLVDLDFGQATGLSLPEASAAFPDTARDWLERPHTVTFPGGESIGQVRARCAAFVWRARRLYPGQQVVAVTHQVVLRVLAGYLLGMPESALWHIDFDTASLTVFALGDGVARLVKSNETAHLAALAAS